MTNKNKWTPIGGITENPGVWDTGNGAVVYVAVRGDGVIRRAVHYYASGRGSNTTYYTAGSRVGDEGGAYPPAGVRTHRRAQDAAREEEE